MQVRGKMTLTGLLLSGVLLAWTVSEAAVPPLLPRTHTRDLVQMMKNVAGADTSTVASVGEESPSQLGSPFQIGRTPEYSQTMPAVAFGGSNYLVVWQEARGSTRDIYGIQMSPSCSVLTRAPFVISAQAGDQVFPAVASDGTDYLVVWAERSGESWDICGARVSQSGSVLDPEGVVISAQPGDQTSPDVSFDGTCYLVVWSDRRRGTADIYGARVQPTGNVLDQDGIPICAATTFPDYPAVVSGTTESLVVWHDFRNGTYDIYGARVALSGAVLDTAGIPISLAAGHQRFAAVSSSDTGYLVVWSDERREIRDIYGARVVSSGAALDPDGIEIFCAPEGQWYPSVSSDGTNYLVVWEHEFDTVYDNIYGARVSGSGNVLGPGVIDVAESWEQQERPAIAFDGTNYVAVWQDNRVQSWDIWATPIRTDGGVVSPEGIPLSMIVFDQLFPAACLVGADYLIVWEDYRSDSSDIYGCRVSSSGFVFDPYGTEISTSYSHQWYPAVASGDSVCLVVWEDDPSGSSDIYGSRVSSSGTPLDSEGIPISVAANRKCSPAVAFGGTNYLVVWSDERNGIRDICGARVGLDGLVADRDGFVISAGPFDQEEPSLAFDGTNYLVVWSDERTGSWDIYGAFVDREGGVINATPIRISMAACDETSPQVAFDGANYLVVWEDCRHGSRDIYAARVTSSGNVLDPDGIAVSISKGYELRPAVAFAGANYLVVWEDYYRSWRPDGNIYGTWVGPDGSVHVPGGFPISASAAPELRPVVVQGVGCSALVAYACWMGSVFGRFSIWGVIWTGPTNVVFSSASATGENGYVSLSWEMGEDVSARDFMIRRAETPEGDYDLLDVPVVKTSTCSFSCVDRTVLTDKTYWYKIALPGIAGEEVYGPIGVYVPAVPAAYCLHQNHPNPFNPLCTIRYEIPMAGRVCLRVFDVTGSLVRTVLDAHRESGSYSEVWDGRAQDGRELASGVYFYRLEAGDFVATRKMVLLR